MNKIALIIQREYWTRVKKKSFIIMTFLSPIIFAAMMVVPAWLASQEDTKEKVIAVDDVSGRYAPALQNTSYIRYQAIEDVDKRNSRQQLTKEFDALLVINTDLLQNEPAVQLYSDGQITMDITDNIKSNLNRHLRQLKLESYNIEGLDSKIKEINNLRVSIKTIRLDEDGTEKQSSAEFAMVIGIISAFLIYIIMIMYGTQVMRGVIEEKTSRIVEVMISSVKPFQLMMGKILGIGMVALTQFFLWIILTVGVVAAVQTVFFSTSEKVQITQSMEVANQTQADEEVDAREAKAQTTEAGINKVISMLKDANLLLILGMFVFYFIGGYLIYSALFAAIGSAIDNETETQQFIMPVMIPLILSIYVAMAVMRNPHGDIAFWFSMVPLTSPIVMMSRIPFDVPLWELLLSMLVLVASFILFTWFAARVYRTGILMYGKKVSYKEIWKWFIQAGN
ncbi:ABC-2 type transport system permease protein [Saccharicrinis carchari]|uniref:ABC-2 type transport system permease protein n=1 Tax=Saccharicrinis carchari TaxID=1168039 RepID=A0A521D589_SACCC|nr:ABC transporter permease [Saccharicrinis carchari]SMO66849.1 ABC-2 type transport system permease protein [Saccharicrinis carchari]